MVITSKAYQDEQAQPLREKSYVYVYMGLFNQIATNAADVSSDLTEYSAIPENIDYVFRTHNKDNVYAKYATLEEGFTRVDNTNAFLPRSSELYDNHQGLVAAYIDDKIRIVFTDAVNIDIKGFTIDFGESYPTSFTITNGHDSYHYEKESPDLFSCEDQYDDCSYIDIIPGTMVRGNQRLRINYIEFGVGLSFSNEEVISTQRRNTVAHLSDSLPLKAFDVTISNLSRRFSQDNPKSFSNYIQQGQKVTFSYGRDIYDEWGDYVETYMIPGGVTYLKTWSSNDSQAKFSTVGRLDLMDSEFYKSWYYGRGEIEYQDGTQEAYYYITSAKSLAEFILQDAGLTSDEYRLDSYLDTVDITNPIPPMTHKACLQTIANLTKSVLYEDRDGKICISSSFVPGKNNISWTDTSNIYQNDIEVFDKNYYFYIYATLEDDFTRVDNTMHFFPRYYEWKPETFTPIGVLSNIGGGAVTFEFDFAWSFYNCRIEFAETIPSGLVVTFYDGVGTVIASRYFIHEEVQLVNVISGYFHDVKSVEVLADFNDTYEEHTLVNEFGDYLADDEGDYLGMVDVHKHRAHIKHILFDKISNYEITNMDLKDKPTATSIDLVKNVNVKYYVFHPENDFANDMKQITTVEVKEGINTIRFANPMFAFHTSKEHCRLLWEDTSLQEWSDSKDYVVGDLCKYRGYKYNCIRACKGVTPEYNSTYWTLIPTTGVSIVNRGAYYIDVNVTSIPSGNPKLVVYARPINVDYKTVTRSLHDIGNDVNLSNQLVATSEMAADLADFIEEHVNNDTEYTISYRGEPALDCDDMVYLENQFVEDNLCRIEEEEISTGIGMSLTNSMKLRRISYGNTK